MRSSIAMSGRQLSAVPILALGRYTVDIFPWGCAVPDVTAVLMFGRVILGMALTPGPNMIYLISRSISQGRRAGFISLGGVAVGFLF